MRLANPIFLLLLGIIPLLWWRGYFKKRPGGSLRFPTLEIVKQIGSPSGLRRDKLLLFLRSLAISFIVLTLARPQAGQSWTETITRGVDIILTLDVSGSMKAEDFKPHNRLYVAKEVIKEFITTQKGNRLGMVVFARDPYLQCPLTLDYSTLVGFLDYIQIGMLEDGTAIGMAIASAVNRLKEHKGTRAQGSKVIILLTDGRNNAGAVDPLTAAQAAEALGIKIYTVGAGKKGAAPFPVDDPIFGRRYVWIREDLDEETLQKIAETTGGMYFRATDPEGLREIYKKIARMEKVEIKTKEFTRYTELFPYFLFGGVVFLGLEIGLGNTLLRKIP